VSTDYIPHIFSTFNPDSLQSSLINKTEITFFLTFPAVESDLQAGALYKYEVRFQFLYN
jgi:hypothetical protein